MVVEMDTVPMDKVATTEQPMERLLVVVAITPTESNPHILDVRVNHLEQDLSMVDKEVSAAAVHHSSADTAVSEEDLPDATTAIVVAEEPVDIAVGKVAHGGANTVVEAEVPTTVTPTVPLQETTTLDTER